MIGTAYGTVGESYELDIMRSDMQLPIEWDMRPRLTYLA